MTSTDSVGEIEDILKEVAKVKGIKNYQVVPDSEVSHGDGFLSSFYKGDVIDKDTGESFKIAIKMAPKWQFFDCKNIFGNEINFYSKVLPALKQLQHEAKLSDLFDNTPEYFASCFNDSSKFIALEHLQPEGYILHDKKEFLSQEQLNFIFKLYGKFHALSFVLRKQNYEKYQEISQGFKDVFHLFTDLEDSKEILARTVKESLGNLDGASDAFKAAEKVLKNIIPTFNKAVVYNGRNRCLTHGDCWSNNMMHKFAKSGELEDVKLLDFQLTRDGTPVHDLSYFFYSSACKSDLDALENYLKIYHNSLSEVIKALGENPEEILPYDVLIKEWKDNALMGVCLGLQLWQIKLIAKEEYEDILKDAGDEDEEKKKLFESLVKKALQSDAFKTRSRDILIHAYEFGILTEDKAA